jgi:hypothetical protein
LISSRTFSCKTGTGSRLYPLFYDVPNDFGDSSLSLTSLNKSRTETSVPSRAHAYSCEFLLNLVRFLDCKLDMFASGESDNAFSVNLSG